MITLWLVRGVVWILGMDVINKNQGHGYEKPNFKPTQTGLKENH
jgi:2,3-bisphosphoglycerate-independent phosphoglycerate mutase